MSETTCSGKSLTNKQMTHLSKNTRNSFSLISNYIKSFYIFGKCLAMYFEIISWSMEIPIRLEK